MLSWTKFGSVHHAASPTGRRALFARAALAACLPVLAAGLHGTPTLLGVVVENDGVWLALRAETGIQRWVQVGGQFDDYRIERWNMAGRTATLRRGRESIELQLVADAVNQTPEIMNGIAGAGVWENIGKLAASACQRMIARETGEVGAEELLGPEESLRKIEPVAGENYADIFFTVTDDGVQIVMADTWVPLRAVRGQLRIQVGPTQSLAAISRRLKIPVRKLVELNPGLSAEKRISEWTSVRLR
jgi:hypothetical protein